MVLNESRTVLENIHAPALILSRTRAILAANEAVHRLCGKFNGDSLVGKDIHNLGFTLIPADHPERFTTEGWDSLLDACMPSRRDPSELRGGDDEKTDSRPHTSSARDFWDDEEHKFPVVADVLISHGDLIPASRDEYPKTWLRARMSMTYLPSEGELMYLVEFHRPLQRDSLSVPQSVGTSDAQMEDVDTDEKARSIFPAEDSSEREKQVHDKVSEKIPYFSALFDESGRALHFSQSWGRVTGMSHETTIGNGWFQAIHPDDRPAMMDAWAKVVDQQERSWTWEARYRRVDRSHYWALIRLESSERQSGNIGYWYGSMIDVDVLLRTRQESENRRKAVLELVAHTDLCLWGLKEDRTLSLQEGSLQWDPMAALDREVQETRSSGPEYVNIDSLVSHLSISDTVEEIFAEKSSTKTLEHRDQGRWYRSTLIADRTGHAPHQHLSQATHGVLGLTIDITDVRSRGDLEAQNEILTARERAATEASELKSRFVANISHELRTPLAGIIGMNDLLMESLLSQTDNGDLRHFSENIRSSAAQLLTVINDVLDLSKIEAGRLELEDVPFRICQLVDSVHGMMGVQAQKKGLSLIKIVDVLASLVVVGDLNRLHQIFLNLIGNSIKFTQTGTVTLHVSVLSGTESDEQDNDDGRSRSRSQTGELPYIDELTRIQFIVEDTGCGMSKTTTEKIFEAFSQADSSTARNYGGTGLGLTISRQLVEMMGGTIHFTSKLNVGTKAVVIIPFRIAGSEIREVDSSITNIFDGLLTNVETVAHNAPRGSPPNLQDRMSAAGGGDLSSAQSTHATSTLSMGERKKKLVLIVEDNAVNMKIAMLMTNKLGLPTITACNGEEALELLDTRAKSQLPSPDIILMDCMMPVMDGYKATQSLRQDRNRFSASTRTIPIIALTASAHKGDEERCLEAGMDGYLIKPVNKKKLEEALVHWALIAQERLAQIQEDKSAGEKE